MSDHDFMPIDGWDHLEIWVGNAKQSAYFYENAFGFTRTAYAGPETGVRDRASYVLEQGDIRLVLTSGLLRQRHLQVGRGQGGQRQGRRARCSGRDECVSAGGSARRARRDRAALGRRRARRVELASIGTYGDNVHTFVNRSEYSGSYLPGFVSISPNGNPSPGLGLISIDHVVGNVELGRMDEWVGFYERVLGSPSSRTSPTRTSRPSTRRSCRR